MGAEGLGAKGTAPQAPARVTAGAGARGTTRRAAVLARAAARRGIPRAEDDAAAWSALARSVTPLPGRAAPPAPPPSVTVVPPPHPAPPPVAPPRPTPPPEIAVGAPPAGLDARRWNGLRRGRLRPERQLDLHGMRAEQAHGAVQRFLLGAQADGLRCVCIVTGKGSTEAGGTLRRELPHWLNAPGLRPLVLAAAHPHSANTGAVHLLLRRRK